MPFLDVCCKNTHLPQMRPQDLLACWERSDTVAVLLVSVSDILQPCTKLASRQFLADIIDIILFFFFLPESGTWCNYSQYWNHFSCGKQVFTYTLNSSFHVHKLAWTHQILNNKETKHLLETYFHKLHFGPQKCLCKNIVQGNLRLLLLLTLGHLSFSLYLHLS